MRRPAQLVAVPVLILCWLFATSARAEEPPEPPSVGLLVAGLAVAVGGGALSLYGAHKYDESSGTGIGPSLLNSLGSLVMQGGGAIETYWAWRHGEYRLATDLKAGVPLRSRRPMAMGGLAVGAVALAGIYVGAIAVFAKSFSCVASNTEPDDARRCTSDVFTTVTIITLAAGGVLLVAAPMVGYGFGYDSAAKRAGHPLSSNRWLLSPSLFPGGAGAQLLAQF